MKVRVHLADVAGGQEWRAVVPLDLGICGERGSELR